MIPSSALQGKGNSILRRENKWHLYSFSCQRGGRKLLSFCCPFCIVQLFCKTLDPFFLLLCFPYNQKIHLSRFTWPSLSITYVSKFHLIKVWIEEIWKIKYPSKSRNQIWSKSCPGMWWMGSFSSRQKGCPLAVSQQPARHAILVRGL